MKIIRAGILGFCTGVRRAVETAFRASLEPEAGVFTLGPLIHNARILESLKEKGVVCLRESDIHELPENAVVIIRAHGVPPALEKKLAARGVRIIDATCPRVKVNQGKAGDFARNGFYIFLAGEKNHAEIEGVRGYAEDGFERVSSAFPSCFAVSNPADAENAAQELYRREPRAKTALIGQTTIGHEEYRAIGEKILRYFPSLDITDSICGATADRQNALRELCGSVDAVIVAGSRESANTRRLLLLARELGKPAWLAENAADIPPEITAYETVGISAGASTPDTLIDEIENVLFRIE